MYPVAPCSYCIHFIDFLRILATTNSPFPPLPHPPSLPFQSTTPSLQDCSLNLHGRTPKGKTIITKEMKEAVKQCGSFKPPPQKVQKKGMSNHRVYKAHVGYGLSFLQLQFMVTYLVDDPIWWLSHGKLHIWAGITKEALTHHSTWHLSRERIL